MKKNGPHCRSIEFASLIALWPIGEPQYTGAEMRGRTIFQNFSRLNGSDVRIYPT